MAHSPRLTALAVATLVAASACRHRVEETDPVTNRDAVTARERCALAFAGCAPPFRVAPDEDVHALDVRRLVRIASRLDVPDRLAAAAAKELLAVAEGADEAKRLDLAEALEDAAPTIARCRCDEFASQLEQQGVVAALASRAPPRAVRTPEHWAERLAKVLGEERELARRAATLVATGDDAASAEAEQRRADADRRLCEVVHAARATLPGPAFEDALALAYQRRALEAGQGSAIAARRSVDRHATTEACEAAPEEAAPADER